jgi:hypothetical protein
MNKSRKTSNIYNIVTYDDSGNVVLPASLTLGTSPASNDNSSKVATTSWIASYISSLSLATSSSVTTAIANLVAAAPTTLDTLNELATALGNDPNFATTVSASIGTKVPQARTITINGTAYDLSADRSWTIAAGVTSFNTRTGAITLSSSDVTTALGYTPMPTITFVSPLYVASGGEVNIRQATATIDGYLSSTDWATFNAKQDALGYTPVTNARTITINGTAYDLSADRSWTISTSDSTKLPLAGGTMTGALVVAAGDRGFEVNTSGGISLYSNEINAGALGGTGTIYMGWRRTTQVNVGVPMVLSSSISATSASFSGSVTINNTSTLILGIDDTMDRTVVGGASRTRLQLAPPSHTGAEWTFVTYDDSSNAYIRIGYGNGSSSFQMRHDGYTTIAGNVLLHAANYSSYALPLTGGVMTGSLVNNTDGAVLMESNTSENNNWLWKESSKSWGLFWFNRGSQAGQSIGGYTTVGAELMFMGGNSGIAMPTGWTGYQSGSYIAAMISNYTGYIYSASTVYAATSMVVGGNTVWHAGNLTNLNQLSNGPGYITSSDEINRAYRGIIQDTRSGQRTPNDYDDYRVHWEFTNQIVSGWHSVMTMQGWHDGYAAWQIIGPSDSAHENWYLRSGNNTTWNSLRSIIHSGNIGSQSVSSATTVTHYSGRTDGTAYNVVWAAGNPSHMYSCDAVKITSSDGTLTATNLTATSNVRGNDVYTTGGWFRNHTNNAGIYWSNTSWHIYPSNSSDMNWRSGSTTTAVRMVTSDDVARGYFYANNSNEIGILANDGNWGLRITSGKTTYLHGSLYVNYGGASSSIYMYDSDEGTREIHCNSNRIGFLNQSSSWGAWCDDGGNWLTGAGMYATIFYDYDNGGYYLDPNSMSNLYAIQMPHLGNGTSNLVVNNGGSENWGAIRIEGGSGNLRIGKSDAGRSWSGRVSLAMHVGASESFRVHSDGWDSLFEVWGSSGYARLKGSLEVGSDVYLGTRGTWLSSWLNQNVTTGASPSFSEVTAGYHRSYYLTGRYDVSVDHTYGIYFQNYVDYSYAIFRESGGWTHPYPDLRIAFHTGIKIGAYYGYNGTRFYNNSDMATITASVNDGDNNFRGYYDIIAYASDKRLKHNVKPIQNAVSKIMSLTGMTYEWNTVASKHGWEPGKEREAGVFAQDVQAVLPEAVRPAPFDHAHDENGNSYSKSGENFLTVKYEKIVPLLIEGIKEQQAQIEAQGAQITELMEIIKTLKGL